MEKLRILLANQPRMHRELLRQLITQQLDMDVVAEELDPVQLLLTVRQTEADVVVLTLPKSGEDPGLCSHLLSEYPNLVVLALSGVQDDASLYRLEIVRQRLASTADGPLLAALRQATRRTVDQVPGVRTGPRQEDI